MSAESKAFQVLLAQGDRLFRRHLDATESANLLDDCLNTYARALDLVPDSPAVLVRMAKVLTRQGQFVKAERLAAKAAAFLAAPEEPAGREHQPADKGRLLRELNGTMGFLQAQSGNLDAARRFYRQAISADWLGSCRARLGFFRESLGLARQAGFSLKGLRVLMEAAYALVSGILLYPWESERMCVGYQLLVLPQLLLAYAHDELGQPDSALSRYRELFRQFPGLAGLGVVISDIYREKGQPEKAAFYLEKVISRHPANLDAHFHLARLLEQKEDFEGVAEIYERLTRLRPGDPHVFCNLANAYYYSQHYKLAVLNYETALHLGTAPKWKAMVAQSLGNLMADYMQNSDAAIAYYEMARSLAPDEVENYIQLGLLYFNGEDYANAELVYRKALAIAPENPRLHSNMGYLRWIADDVESALQSYEKAIALDPAYEIPLNNMGVIYLDTLGQIRKSIDLFKQAIEVNEGYALAWYNLGRAHSFLDQRLEAAHCFQTAQSLNEFSKELDNDELIARINHLFETEARD